MSDVSKQIAADICIAVQGKPISAVVPPLFSLFHTLCTAAGVDPHLEFSRLLSKLDGATHRTTTLN